MTLNELADRCEAAEGPDRELDCLIAVHALGWLTQPNKGWPEKTDYGYLNDEGGETWPGHGGDQLVRHFTASLDAAMTLVPMGLMVAAVRFSNGSGRANIHDGQDAGGQGIDVCAATPALALCAAALRARAAMTAGGRR